MDRETAVGLMHATMAYEWWQTRFEKGYADVGDPDLEHYVRNYFPQAPIGTRDEVWDAFDGIEDVLVDHIASGTPL